MNVFEAKIEQLKKENDDLINFRLIFNETVLILEGDLIEDGKHIGDYSAGVLAYYKTHTKKVYV